jgi:hypothetical protein
MNTSVAIVFQRGPSDWDDEPTTPLEFAQRRRPNRTYVSRTFTLNLEGSRDHGHPARYITKVFDELPGEYESEEGNVTTDVVSTTPGGRKQIQLQVAREGGQVREILLQQVTIGNDAKLKRLLRLDREGAKKLIDLIALLPSIDLDVDDGGTRLDDDLLRDVMADPNALKTLYARDPEAFRKLIEDDATAADVVAVASRREAVTEFRTLLTDPIAFEARKASAPGGTEAVWQRFFEANPWIFGVGLSSQLLTSWDERRLEQVVAGFSVATAGKRADAVMRTNGRIRSLALVEIKHHTTPLLASTEYRAGCWHPSAELTGGVAQAQQTVHSAVTQIGEKLEEVDSDGAETGSATYLLRPRTFLVAGDLAQLKGDAGVNRAKHRSFEIYRRNLVEPEVVTFDELLARAEWHISHPGAKER